MDTTENADIPWQHGHNCLFLKPDNIQDLADNLLWAQSNPDNIKHAPTTIGSNCYIGPNTIIAKGITIGEGCIVGAMSLVLKDIPPHSKAWGNPAKVMGTVE